MRTPSPASCLAVFLLSVGATACSSEPGSDKEPSTDCTSATWYRDVDGDGHGDADGPYEACEAPAGHVAEATDCDDQDPTVFPGATETCNGVDDDCNGTIDDGAGTADTTFYADTDGDGYGDPDVSVLDCVVPEGHVDNDLDCNDADPTIHPDGEDAPRDGVDGDCDGADATTLSERAHVGDVNLLTEADVTAFCDDYDGVIGDLQLAGGGLPATLALDCLLEVTGDFVVSADATETLSLPNLWWVGGELRVAGNPALTTLDVSGLRFVDAGLVQLDNDSLDAPTFGALEEVGELVRVDGGGFPELTRIVGDLSLASGMTLNALETVGGSVSIRDGSLTEVSLPSLQTAGAVELQSVGLTTFVADELTTITSLSVDLPSMVGPLVLDNLTAVAGDLDVLAGAADVSMTRLVTVGGSLGLGHSGVSELDLASLETVGGSARLGGEDLDAVALDALQRVDGPLDITCTGCAAVDLGQLTTVVGDLSLDMGIHLEALDLGVLSTVEGGFSLTEAHRLRTLALPALEVVQGDATLDDLEYLEAIDLGALADPGGTVSIVNLPALSTLDLSSLSLEAIPGHVIVRDNPLLETLTLGSLGAASGGLTVESTPLVSELDLSGLTSVGQLTLSGDFTTLDLSALESTTGTVSLSLDALASLDLSTLRVVGGDFDLSGEVGAVDLSALELVGGSGALQLPSVTTLSLPLLEEVFTDLTVELNGATSADFSSLRSVGGSAQFVRGSDLGALSLPALDSVGSLTFESLAVASTVSVGSFTGPSVNLEIIDCDGIATLDGFADLTEVGGSLTIDGNALLADVSGLAGITSIGVDLVIRDNPLLPTAEAEALAEDDIGEGNIGGGVVITGNGP